MRVIAAYHGSNSRISAACRSYLRRCEETKETAEANERAFRATKNPNTKEYYARRAVGLYRNVAGRLHQFKKSLEKCHLRIRVGPVFVDDATP